MAPAVCHSSPGYLVFHPVVFSTRLFRSLLAQSCPDASGTPQMLLLLGSIFLAAGTFVAIAEGFRSLVVVPMREDMRHGLATVQTSLEALQTSQEALRASHEELRTSQEGLRTSQEMLRTRQEAQISELRAEIRTQRTSQEAQISKLRAEIRTQRTSQEAQSSELRAEIRHVESSLRDEFRGLQNTVSAFLVQQSQQKDQSAAKTDCD